MEEKVDRLALRLSPEVVLVMEEIAAARGLSSLPQGERFTRVISHSLGDYAFFLEQENKGATIFVETRCYLNLYFFKIPLPWRKVQQVCFP